MYLATGESHIKIRRPVDVTWRALEFSCLLSSTLKFPWNATDHSGVLDLWHSVLDHTSQCQPPISNELWNANSVVKIAFGMPQTKWLRSKIVHGMPRADSLSLWPSGALQCTHLRVECGIRLKSSPSHFTSRVPLFEASYLFAARLLEYKIPMRPMRQIV
jgi:hypothetical protein